MHRNLSSWSASLLLIVLSSLAGCGGSSTPSPQGGTGPTASPAVTSDIQMVLAEFNRGNALMEQYLYSDAARAYEKVLETAPDWTAAQFNLGLAYLNMHGNKDAEASVDAARETLMKIVEAQPNHPYAHFALGMLYQHAGEDEAAVKHFAKVYEVDSDDLYVLYKYAETLLSTGQEAQGVALLEEALEENPGFISATYRLAMLYRRNPETREKAGELLARFQALQPAELAGGSYTVQTSYGMAGKYYSVLGADELPLPQPESDVSAIVFTPEPKSLDVALQSWECLGGKVELPGLAVADVDSDGDLDLCLAATDAQGSAVLLMNDGAGSFTKQAELAKGVLSPCFGDVDNDGDVDLWLGCGGADQVLLNDGAGNFAAAGYEPVAGADLPTHTARLLDLDSDGDLDFLALRAAKGGLPVPGDASAAAGSAFITNLDGTFADAAGDLGLAFEETAVAGMIYSDLDSDMDLDLIMLPAAGTPLVWANDRMGDYRLLDAAATGLNDASVVSLVTGDPDKDGDPDLLVFTRDGLTLWTNKGRMQFEKNVSFTGQFGSLGGTGGQFVDLDNDGDVDILIGDATRADGSRGPVVLVNAWPEQKFIDTASLDAGSLLTAVKTDGDASCVAADFTGDGLCDILLAACGQPLLLLENATPGGNWFQLNLIGTRPGDNKARSNASAIGAKVEVKSGQMYQQYYVGGSSGPVAMLPLRVHAGLGDHAKVDWLKVIWPDAVLQAELELAASQTKALEELSRKTSSCPYLFVWNGTQFEFVSDFGGVGGLGYLVEPGLYAPPDPTEYLRIPNLQPLDGQYVLQALTPLEEVTYFDEAKLIAVDHPQGTEVHPNEMMAINAAMPEFEVFCVREPWNAVRAVDHRGVDVTAEVAKIDRRCAGATSLDHRFAGLADEHFVELEFGDVLANRSGQSRLILFLYGWVEYGYSSTNFAASQAGQRARAPSIEVERNGQWVEMFHEVGYPAGINHMMTLDVSDTLQPGDRRLRISTNMEMYWDRIFLAEHDAAAAVKLREVAPTAADLHFRGYPREYSPDGRHPNLCDYNNIDPTVGWKLMAGDFTRFGDVTDLVLEPDDCFVIMGHGEEITLRFDADAFGPIPEGCSRTFILKSDSYCKDMDLYTAYPDAVEPLPFHGMSGYPYGGGEQYPDTEQTRAYRQQYNTRRVRVR